MSDEKDMEALRLLRAFSRVVDPARRRELIGLVQDAANIETGTKGPSRQGGRLRDESTKTKH